jgi:hypothetical protein
LFNAVPRQILDKTAPEGFTVSPFLCGGLATDLLAIAGFGAIVNYTVVKSDTKFNNALRYTVPQFAVLGISDSAKNSDLNGVLVRSFIQASVVPTTKANSAVPDANFTEFQNRRAVSELV